MSDAYGGRNSRRSNAPIGLLRREIVYITETGEITLSGSPIEYFEHQDYRTGAGRVTGTYKLGIAALYNETDTAWKSPATYVDSVSEDGYTITLTGYAGHLDVGDHVSVYYYSSPKGTRDATTAAQAGDPVAPEWWDSMGQKINDCPPLNFEQTTPAMLFDVNMAYSTAAPGAGAWNTVLQFSSPGGGETWSITDTPFYVTAMFIAWDGASLTAERTSGHTASFIKMTIDSGTTISWDLETQQKVCLPANYTTAGYDQYTFMNLGLVECNSDLKVEQWFPVAWGGTSHYTSISGYYS
jgi:hypothetical protein